MMRIFISYSHADKLFVEAISKHLRRIYGTNSVWYDQDLLGGEEWWTEICKQISESTLVICLISPEANTSEYCLKEQNFALELRKPIIPIIVRSNTQLPSNLRSRQRIDLVNGIDAHGVTELQAAINRIFQRSTVQVTETSTHQKSDTSSPPSYSNISSSGEGPKERPTYLHSYRRKIATWGIALIIVLILFLTALYLLIRWNEGTLYFVVDGSAVQLEEVPNYIQVGTQGAIDVELGLAVFGLNLDDDPCNDTVELVPLGPKSETIPAIVNQVDILQMYPTNSRGSLQNALLFAIDRIEGRRGEQRILAITSEIDLTCNNLNRGVIDQYASENNVLFKLTVVAVGNIPDEQQQLLQSFADETIFDVDEADLPEIIKDSVENLRSPYFYLFSQ